MDDSPHSRYALEFITEPASRANTHQAPNFRVLFPSPYSPTPISYSLIPVPYRSLHPNQFDPTPLTVYHPSFIPFPCSTKPSPTIASSASSAKAAWASFTKPKTPNLGATLP